MNFKNKQGRKRPQICFKCNKGDLLEREKQRMRERDSFKILYTGYLLSIVKIKIEIESEIKRERERGKRKERERKKEEKKREKQKQRERDQTKSVTGHKVNRLISRDLLNLQI